jgi:hypothetical protein
MRRFRRMSKVVSDKAKRKAMAEPMLMPTFAPVLRFLDEKDAVEDGIGEVVWLGRAAKDPGVAEGIEATPMRLARELAYAGGN